MDNVIITEEDVMNSLNQFTRVPPFLLKIYINHRSNLVRSFRSQIETQQNQLSDQDLAKIKKLLQMPVGELQDIMNKAYEETGKRQLQMLGDPRAKPFIEDNLKELEKILFNGE